jgi:segregation and condensation protein A
MLDLEVVGEFLVMAATLIQIKSRMLLPPNPSDIEEEEEDPRDDLVKRLQEYKVFKEIADQMKVMEQERQKLYPRKQDEETRKELHDDAKEVYFEANLFDLINAFSKTLQKFKEQEVYEVEQEDYTVDDKIHYILHSLLKKSHMLLTDFFLSSRNKSEAIVTFMAVLELIRLKEIKVMQKRLFSGIEVVRNTENMVSIDDTQSPQYNGTTDILPENVDPADKSDQDNPSE